MTAAAQVAETPAVRDARVRPDAPWAAYSVIAFVCAVMAASMIFSLTAITEAAAWTKNPWQTHFLAAVFIDGAIMTYTVSLAVLRWRRQGVARTIVILIVFTALSVFINAVHVASGWDWKLDSMEAWTGVIMASSAPIAALLAAEEVTRLVFVPRPEKAQPEPEPTAPPVREPLALGEPIRRPAPLLSPRPATTLAGAL